MYLFYKVVETEDVITFGGVITDTLLNELRRFDGTDKKTFYSAATGAKLLISLEERSKELLFEHIIRPTPSQLAKAKLLSDYTASSLVELFVQVRGRAPALTMGPNAPMMNAICLMTVFNDHGLIPKSFPETFLRDGATKMKRFVLSDEQMLIVEAACTHNVLVDAVAGSGKTTTIVGLVEHMQAYEEQVVVITYNRKLKDETVARLGFEGCVYTYHGLATRLAGRTIKNDDTMEEFVNQGVCKGRHIDCDLLVIDEAQDLTPLFYRFVCKYIASMIMPPRLVLLGDHKQCIYRHAGADTRFFTHADELFPHCADLPWKRLSLSYCFRFGSAIANFVNSALSPYPMTPAGHNKLLGCKNESKVCYWITDVWKEPFYQQVYEMVNGQPGNWLIVAPYLFPKEKGKASTVSMLTEYLSKRKVLCYVAREGSAGRIDSRITDGKVTFLTYAKSKGLERDNVIVLDFDDGLARSQGRAVDTLPDDVYVVCTRARRSLYLVRQAKNRVQSFVNLEASAPYYTRRVTASLNPSSSGRPRYLTRQLDRLLTYASHVWHLCDFTTMYPTRSTSLRTIPEICGIAQGSRAGTFEDVSDLNGHLSTSIYVAASALIGDSNPTDTIDLSTILTAAVERWCTEKQTKYIKRQLAKPYAWINQEEARAIYVALFNVFTHLQLIGPNQVERPEITVSKRTELSHKVVHQDERDSMDYLIYIYSNVLVTERHLKSGETETVMVVVFTQEYEKSQALVCMLHWLANQREDGRTTRIYGFSGLDGQLHEYCTCGNERQILDILIERSRHPFHLPGADSAFISEMLELSAPFR